MKKIYKIRIVYKSGYTHDFECYKFEFYDTALGGKYVWSDITEQNMPIKIGVDDIAAVWQIGMREE